MRDTEDLAGYPDGDIEVVLDDDGPPDGSSADALLAGMSPSPEEEAAKNIAALLR